MFESKIEKFQRLFNKRMIKATEAIRILGNLNSPNYEIDPVLVAHEVTAFEEQWMGIREQLGLNPVSTTPQVIQELKDKTNDVKSPDYGGVEWGLMDQAFNALVDGDVEKAKELMLEGFKT